MNEAFFGTLTNGIRGDLHQEAHEVFPVRTQARAPQLRITSGQGRIRILAIRLASEPMPERSGTDN